MEFLTYTFKKPANIIYGLAMILFSYLVAREILRTPSDLLNDWGLWVFAGIVTAFDVLTIANFIQEYKKYLKYGKQ